MRRREVRSQALYEPTDRANHTLVALLGLEKSRAVVCFVSLGTSVDGKAQAIRCGIWCGVTGVNIVVLNKVRCKSSLAEVNADCTI